ncbi:histidine kinase [Streptomyces sp. P9(2023)]|uniref:sensor histidine kinase n=1 Tax=Streptomyces sp. P9(2023) TaxID=3064394 RepID=UPI0028F43043|nr:histidine kinase [Streptomyces sp. P9(2023)]MDT9689033.1 histidine kinase [Streptomyces sp. P9(2023)]
MGERHQAWLRGALRETPGTLRAELWTWARDPLPRHTWLGRLPHAHVALFAVLVGIGDVNVYARVVGPFGQTRALIVVQVVALVLALSRPAGAWWISTTALFLIGLSSQHAADAQGLWPWSAYGIALQTLLLFLLALRVSAPAAGIALAVTVLSGALNIFLTSAEGSLTGGTIAFSIAVIVGAAQRGSRVARTRLTVQEELTAEERARRTLLEERGRIARELHDVVAHHMSVISIQAQVAPHLVENPSDELREHLAGIRQNAVEALTELRRVLGVLRAEDPDADRAGHAPQPTLDRLDDLLANVRAAGLTVDATTTGERMPLAPGIELSAYRIVQEALSNAMRHAPGARVRVEIGHRPTGLTLRVANTPPTRPADPASALSSPGPPGPPGPGHGLLGMRERTTMLGGELAVGPTPDGGYEVTATLPVPNTPQKDGT